MIRNVLLALLSGMLLGGGGVGSLAYIALQTESDRILILETDMHRVRRDFDMGMTMADDVRPGQGVRSGQPIEPPSIRHLFAAAPGRRLP